MSMGVASPAGKPEWRARLLAARRQRTTAGIIAARSAISRHLLANLPSIVGASSSAAPTVCAYVPLPSEPLSPDLPSVLAARGYRVLLPVTTAGEPLDWCAADMESAGTDRVPGAGFARGPLGVAEPTGQRLGAAAITQAAVILVPALATDPQGFRLGRGGGFYDRSLALLDEASSSRNFVIPVPMRIAVVFDDEVDLAIPHAAHDARATHVVTPHGGLRAFE